MRPSIKSALLIVGLVTVTMFVCGCPPWYPFPQGGGPAPSTQLDLRIIDGCNLVFEDGTPPSDNNPIKLWPDREVKWINETSIPAVVKIGDYSLFGRWSVRLNPGESWVGRVRSAWSPPAGLTYPIKVVCIGDVLVDGPTPPIKDEPPPPPPGP